jgi:tetratricopeptide (TPR) repeat protein
MSCVSGSAFFGNETGEPDPRLTATPESGKRCGKLLIFSERRRAHNSMFDTIRNLAHPYLQRPAFHLAILVIITAAIYTPSLGHDFVWDDKFIITPIEAYFDFDLVQIFTRSANGYEYLPVRDLTLALDALIWGRNPFGFHLTNLILYLMTIVLCYFTTRSLARLYDEESSSVIAFAASLIFAVHPLNAEPVNWVTGRNNILSFLFILMSTQFFIRGSTGKATFLTVSLIVFVLAAFSKASAVYYPAIPAVLAAVTPALRRQKRPLYAYLIILVAVDLLIVRTHLLTATSLAVVDENLWRFGTHDPLHTLGKALYIPLYYLYRMVQPYPLSVAYPDSGFQSLETLKVLLSALAMGGMIAAALILRKRRTMMTIGILWFLAALVPAMNIFPTNPVIADRYTYHAVYGFALVAAFLLADAMSRKIWVPVIAGALLLAWTSVTFTRGFDWQSDIKLFKSAYEVYPEKGASEYATTLFNYGHYDEAMSILKTHGSNKLGEISFLEGRYLYQMGQYDQALPKLLEVEKSGFNDALLFTITGHIYEQQGKSDQALSYYTKALSPYLGIDRPRYTRPAKEGIRRIQQAMQPRLMKALTAADNNPSDLQLQADAALLLMETNQYREAIRYLERAAAIDGRVWQLWYNIGLCHKKLGNLPEAMDAFDKAIARNGSSLDALNQAGIVHARHGQYAEAISYYQRALRINPNHLQATYNLARVYFQRGELDQARATLLRAHDLATSPIMKNRIRKVLEEPPLNHRF